MSRHIKIGRLTAALLLLACSPLSASEDQSAVELFDAMDAGQITVKFIPLGAAKANVLIQNMTDQPLHVELPDAIAAVPILAQLGPDPGGGNAGGGGATQGVGGGLNAGGNGQGFGNPGVNFGAGGGQRNAGGVMRIAPQKTRKLTATTVCLEHGKPDPNPRIAYRMIPISEFTPDKKVAELCRQLGQGKLTQKTAQAAAWNLANGLDWERIAGLNRIESKYLGNVRFFQPREIAAAKKFAESLSTPAPDVEDYAASR